VSVAILDDYQGVALQMADWGALGDMAAITAFTDHLSSEEELVARLEPFEVVCVMRERTPLPARVLEQLPNLKLIVTTGTVNRTVDTEAAARLGISVANTGYDSSPTIEFAWALILASARNIAVENAAVRSGQWQQRVGHDLNGRTLGVLGLGNIGGQVAAIGKAFGMRVIAWSQNLTSERAQKVGATLVSMDELLSESDFLTIHTLLSKRTKGLIGARELSQMKPTAHLINTSRGQIVVEEDLIAALKAGRPGFAAIDVYATEPLPLDHPFRSLPNVLATPHLGYVSRALYETFYGDTAESVDDWVHGRPLRHRLA
jgi:phosphoglycerate dehydrogenase-like enzyme